MGPNVERMQRRLSNLITHESADRISDTITHHVSNATDLVPDAITHHVSNATYLLADTSS